MELPLLERTTWPLEMSKYDINRSDESVDSSLDQAQPSWSTATAMSFEVLMVIDRGKANGLCYVTRREARRVISTRV